MFEIIDIKLYHLYRIFIANYKMSDIFNTIGHEWCHTCKHIALMPRKLSVFLINIYLN